MTILLLEQVAYFRCGHALLALPSRYSRLLDWHPQDIARIRHLVTRYADLQLGITDAAMIAYTERYQGRVLTTFRRRFDVIARGEGTIFPLPEQKAVLNSP
jgi:predicted nucleic acid-binding protein